MKEPLIEAHAVRKNFGGVEAVRGVDFSVAEGELRCLIGTNGAGKSTFFKMLTGQVRPSGGVIHFRGTDITNLQPHEIARLGIGIKTQNPSVFNGLTVRESLWIAAARRHDRDAAKRVVDNQLAWLSLGDIANKQVGQLAHGQRQWVELGIVLCADPSVILLDEPTAGMTEDETRRYSEIILEINRFRPLIVVEHDMAFIRSIASRITVFDRGAILTEGTVEEVFNNQMVRDIYLGKQAAN